MTTFILVPGACHGGWWFAPLVDRLAIAGHVGVPVTLAGLGEDDSPAGVTLETHVKQATEIARATPRDELMVLVGHSYAGSVISGVADRLAARVSALVYLDAFVPENGDSCYSMTNDEQRRWYIEGAGKSGLAVDPLPFFEERARPQPLATLVQRSTLTGAWRSVRVKHYVAAADWPGESPFAATTRRMQSDAEFRVHVWATRHNVMHDGPDRVLELLEAVAAELA